MTKLQARIVEYLDKQTEPSTRDTILAKAEKVGYKTSDIYTALKGLENLAHVGQWREQRDGINYVCSYPQNDLTKLNQTCLDRGEDW